MWVNNITRMRNFHTFALIVGTGKPLLDCCFSSQCFLLRDTRITSTSHCTSIVNQKPLFLESRASIALPTGIDVFNSFAKALRLTLSLNASGPGMRINGTSLCSSSVLLTTWCPEWRVFITITERIDCGGLSVARLLAIKRRVVSYPNSSITGEDSLTIKLPLTRCLWVPSAIMTTEKSKYQFMHCNLRIEHVIIPSQRP